MWLNITLQAEPFLAVHAPISLLCNWEIKKALLRWSNWWLMKTAYTRFKFEMLSEFWIICCRFCGTCLFSSLETFGWLVVHSHLIGSRGRCWLLSSISFTSSACLPEPKRKHQHIQATTLVGLDMHVDMHVAVLLTSYSTEVLRKKTTRSLLGTSTNGCQRALSITALLHLRLVGQSLWRMHGNTWSSLVNGESDV